LRVGQLSEASFARALRDPRGLPLLMGPFAVRLRTRLTALARQLHSLYRDFPTAEPEALTDFHLALESPRGLRRWVCPQVLFKIDGLGLFEPFPKDTALPLFEWGLNWCIGKRSHQYLMLHAAVVERNGRAMVFPALPGSGKSTLCAALIHRGWRHLSDEFGLVEPETLNLVPCPRPIALKNASIEVIRRFEPEAGFGPLFPKTRKGTVAHLRPPAPSVRRMHETARPGWIVFPRFAAGSGLVLKPLAGTHAFLRLANNAFNYEIMGSDGFAAVANLIRLCPAYELKYGDLDEAVAKLDTLAS
jgi:HprK-related kinase A